MSATENQIQTEQDHQDMLTMIQRMGLASCNAVLVARPGDAAYISAWHPDVDEGRHQAVRIRGEWDIWMADPSQAYGLVFKVPNATATEVAETLRRDYISMKASVMLNRGTHTYAEIMAYLESAHGWAPSRPATP